MDDRQEKDPFTKDLKKHYQIEGSLDISKFRSEQKSKLIKTVLQ